MTPLPEEQGIDIPPGSDIEISVEPSVYKRYSYRWDHCHESLWKYKKSYSKIACEIMCVEEHGRSRLNCYNYFSDLENITEVMLQYPKCPLSFSELITIGSVLGININFPKCNCSEPCIEKKYEYSIKERKIDAEYKETAFGLHEFFENKHKATDLKDNLGNTNLNIYLKSSTYKEMVESPRVTLYTLMSNLGGIIGIFIGISVVHLIDIILDRAFHHFPHNIII